MNLENPPRVVCLCASPAHTDTLTEAARTETAAGRIVLQPGCDMNTSHPLCNDAATQTTVTTRLVELQRRKIDLADEVVVISGLPSGRLDAATAAELAYAHGRGKPIRFWTPPHLLEITDDSTWRLTCVGAQTGSARSCAPEVPCGCTSTSTVRTPSRRSRCPMSATGWHVVVDGTPSQPGSGCWLQNHHALPAAVHEDILSIHGPGVYLLAYDTFYTDDLVLSVDATLDEAAPMLTPDIASPVSEAADG